jgi:ATP-dependent Lon protease
MFKKALLILGTTTIITFGGNLQISTKILDKISTKEIKKQKIEKLLSQISNIQKELSQSSDSKDLEAVIEFISIRLEELQTINTFSKTIQKEKIDNFLQELLEAKNYMEMALKKRGVFKVATK